MEKKLASLYLTILRFSVCTPTKLESLLVVDLIQANNFHATHMSCDIKKREVQIIFVQLSNKAGL